MGEDILSLDLEDSMRPSGASKSTPKRQMHQEHTHPEDFPAGAWTNDNDIEVWKFRSSMTAESGHRGDQQKSFKQVIGAFRSELPKAKMASMSICRNGQSSPAQTAIG